MRNPYEDDFREERQYDGDGAPCAECGDDAVIALRYQPHDHERPLCGRCADHVEACAECEQLFWGPDGHRIIANQRHCATCAARHPLVVGATMAEILSDELQDYFNKVRR